MDIDLLLAIGGWLLFFDCMAASTTATTTISPVPKPRNFLALLALLLFVFLVSTRHVVDHNGPAPLLVDSSTSSMSLVSRRLLSESSVAFQPKPTGNRHRGSSSPSSAGREFEAGAHEVPSGPNPISNR